MFGHWRQTWRRRRRLRSAEDRLLWCEQAAVLNGAFSRALRQSGPDVPPDVVVNRIDWGLEHLRRLSTGIGRPLARVDLALSNQLEAYLTQSYELRNRTLSYLIRWQAHGEADAQAEDGSFAARRRSQDTRRDRDESLLPALQLLRALNAGLAELAPRLRTIAGSWAPDWGSPPLAG